MNRIHFDRFPTQSREIPIMQPLLHLKLKRAITDCLDLKGLLFIVLSFISTGPLMKMMLNIKSSRLTTWNMTQHVIVCVN